MASRVTGRAILWVCTMHLSIYVHHFYHYRIVQSFEAITLNLAASSDSFSLSEEEVSVKSDMVSMHIRKFENLYNCYQVFEEEDFSFTPTQFKVDNCMLNFNQNYFIAQLYYSKQLH